MRLVATFFALSLAPAIFAQGLVNFANTPHTLVSATPTDWRGTTTAISGPRGSYYFALVVEAPIRTNDPTLGLFFTGLYATNTGVDGLFSGGTGAAANWAPGTSQSYVVVGWSADLGITFNPAWLNGGVPPFGGNVGISAYGTGTAGNGTTIPALNLFDDGGNTISSGWILSGLMFIPEPSAAALIAVAAGGSLLYRRQKRTGWPVHIQNASEQESNESSSV